MTKRRLPIFTSLLTVLCLLSACVDEVEQVVYDHAPVKTQFALVMPEMMSKNGRMMDQVVQPDPATFGMEKIYLFPFQLPGKAGSRQLESATPFQGDNILNSNNNEVKPSNRVEGSQPNAVWFENVMVPQQTNYFLMYGVQPPSATFAQDRFGLGFTSDAQKEGFQDGQTQTNLHSDVAKAPHQLSEIRFAPQPIFEKGFFSAPAGGNLSEFQNSYLVRKKWVLLYLSNIVNAGETDNRWYNTKNVELYNLYKQWVGAPDGRNLNASSKSILGLVEDLYRKLTKLETTIKATDPSDTYTEAQKTKDLALIDKIKKVILQGNTVQGNTVDALTVKVSLANDNATGEAAYPLTYGHTDPLFPTCIGLPDGALQVKLTPQEDAPATVDFLHELRNEAIEDVYVYPAQQYYTSRSEIGVSSRDYKQDFVPGMNWADFVTNFTEDYVYPYARTLVLKSPVQFGMANLTTQVRFKPGAEILDAAKIPVTVTNLSQHGFEQAANPSELLRKNITLTGILVSDQREVGWDFTRETATADAPPFMIYDRYLNAGTPDKYQSKMFVPCDEFVNVPSNSTLLYPSKVLREGENDRIFLILEFENGEEAFHGAGQALIPAHSRFYITYMMDARVLFKDNPGKGDGEQLFSSANQMSLQLTITGLSGAYNVLPDTRMVKVNLGIAAKISWGSGFVFNDVEVNQ